jgi:hypothetical protein
MSRAIFDPVYFNNQTPVPLSPPQAITSALYELFMHFLYEFYGLRHRMEVLKQARSQCFQSHKLE